MIGPFSVVSILSSVSLALLVALCSASTALGAPLILNEYNAVGSSKFLDGPSGTASDVTLGRIVGNGGDWFELVVIEDRLDIRGWSLGLADSDGGSDTLVFSDSAMWSELRSGTLITIAEDQLTDVSYDPAGGDWWINVQATDGGASTYITPENFFVNNDDWQLTILDADAGVVFGPTGEGSAPNAGVNSKEVFKLEADPSAVISELSPFYEDGVSSSFGAPNLWGDGANSQDFSALRAVVPEPSAGLLLALAVLIGRGRLRRLR